MPIGVIRNLGEHRSRLLLEKKYQSVQASINAVMSKYRRAGQVPGLLFHSNDDKSYPYLLGQWTGAGGTYDLEEGEQILVLEATMCNPRCRLPEPPGRSQAEGITVVTNQRRISWN